MQVLVEIDAGICGFQSCGKVTSDDGQYVRFEVSSECERIRSLNAVLKHAEAFDAYTEISTGTRSRLLAACSEVIPGCCVGCAVPIGLFKAMQVAAGLALPRDIHIQLSRVEDDG